MKHFSILSFLLLLFLPFTLRAEQLVNLTPVPKQMQVQKGQLTLPQSFRLSTGHLDPAMIHEADKFIATLEQTTGIRVSKTTDDKAFICLQHDPSIKSAEGYRLQITADGIQIAAAAPGGFYYAFQSIKKLLPPHVMMAVREPAVKTYTLPLLQIEDAPRFAYRGFMLDVARHFFPVEEVKRVMDMMSCYKMNKLHLHLSDDQGFRVESTRYPKLNTIGSVRDESFSTDYGGSNIRVHSRKTYGPYYYTKDQIRDLVAYARERHIDIIPEIDMPGHFGAAMAAYPEYSCEPYKRHPVISDESHTPTIPNVADPKAVAFCKNILEELMELFPYPYIHIGGDECDASHWERNATCQAFMKKMHFNHPRQLQSYFTKELADFARTKGRRLIAWNEVITAQGADVKMIQESQIDIVCWTGAENAAKKAASLGLNNIMAPQPTYYINQIQSTDPSEPQGPGQGIRTTLEQVYNYAVAAQVPDDQKHFYQGVQACLWTEYISSPKHMEYMILPRLIAIAETAWSPADKKNFDNFCARMTQDTLMFRYGDYHYGKHYLGRSSSDKMVMPVTSTDQKMFWYRLNSLATDEARQGKCIQLLLAGHPQIGQNGAAAQMLWSADPVEEGSPFYDSQLWAVKEDPQHPGRYALVCKAQPHGSLNPAATEASVAGRWIYDPEEIHYNFILNDPAYYGPSGNNYHYAIRSDRYTGLWMNMAGSGQSFSINLYKDPSDTRAGLWEFFPLTATDDDQISRLQQEGAQLLSGATFYTGRPLIGAFSREAADRLKALLQTDAASRTTSYIADLKEALNDYRQSLGLPQNGQQIRLVNTTEQHWGVTLTDNRKNYLTTSEDGFGQDVWCVKQEAGHQAFQLKNLNTQRWISGTSGSLQLSADQPHTYTYIYDWQHKDFLITPDGRQAIYPISSSYVKDPAHVYVGGVRIQGAAWKMAEVCQILYRCVTADGREIRTVCLSVPVDSAYTCEAPVLKNWKFLGYGPDASDPAPRYTALNSNDTVTVVYQRTACDVRMICRDTYGHCIAEETKTYPYGAEFTPEYPEIPYYTFSRVSPVGEIPLHLQDDQELELVYETEGYNGYWEAGDPQTTLEAGRQYLFYDATTADKRSGFLNVSEQNSQVLTTETVSGLPYFVWTLEAAGDRYKVRNESGVYMPEMVKGTAVTANAHPGLFSFRYQNGAWQIQGQNGLYWNGNVGSMTGWTDAHPYQVYELTPYLFFRVTLHFVSEDQKELADPVTTFVRAGFPYTPVYPELSRYIFDHLSVPASQLDQVGGNLDIDVVYRSQGATGITTIPQTPAADAPIYDLSGRRVAHPVRGIYIQNGRKLLIP